MRWPRDMNPQWDGEEESRAGEKLGSIGVSG